MYIQHNTKSVSRNCTIQNRWIVNICWLIQIPPWSIFQFSELLKPVPVIYLVEEVEGYSKAIIQTHQML